MSKPADDNVIPLFEPEESALHRRMRIYEAIFETTEGPTFVENVVGEDGKITFLIGLENGVALMLSREQMQEFALLGIQRLQRSKDLEQ